MAVGMPLVEGEETLTILPGTLPADELVRRLRDSDAVAIMKLGRNFAKVRAALESAGVADRAWYVERASTPSQQVMPVHEVDPAAVPYFSMVVVPGPLNNPVPEPHASPPAKWWSSAWDREPTAGPPPRSGPNSPAPPTWWATRPIWRG